MTRFGDWMCTATGISFWPLDPAPEEVHIKDIAHALSNICRYNGHVKTFYSVAQHCVLVSRQVRKRSGNPEAIRQGLLHDAAEAYVGDMIRPLKRCLPEYKVVEEKVHASIMKRFDLPARLYPVVKRADEDLLTAEAWALMSASSVIHWSLPSVLDPEIKIRPLAPKAAHRLFVEEFSTLWGAKEAVL